MRGPGFESRSGQDFSSPVTYFFCYRILLQFDAVRNSSRCIMKDEKFASYSVLAVSPHGHMVAIGNIQGTLRLLYWGSE